MKDKRQFQGLLPRLLPSFHAFYNHIKEEKKFKRGCSFRLKWIKNILWLYFFLLIEHFGSKIR